MPRHLLPLALLLLTACPRRPTVGASGLDTRVDVAQLQVQTRVWAKEISGPETAGLLMRYAWVELTGPETAAMNAWARSYALGAIFDDEVPEGVTEQAVGAMIDARGLAIPDPELPFEEERVVTVAWYDQRLVSLCGAEASFTGGAHPNYSSQCIVFSRKEDTPITLGDLFGGEVPRGLVTAAEERLRGDLEIPADQTLEDAGFWFEGGVFSLSADWHADALGLVFQYDPYEVAPYVVGNIEITVPWETVSPWLAPAWRR